MYRATLAEGRSSSITLRPAQPAPLCSMHPAQPAPLHSPHPCTALQTAPFAEKKKLKIRTFFLPNCIFTFHCGKTLSHSTKNYKNTFCKTFSNSANLLRKNEDIIATNRRVSQTNPKQLAVVEDRLHR